MGIISYSSYRKNNTDNSGNGTSGNGGTGASVGMLIDTSNFVKLAGEISQTIEGDVVVTGNVYARGNVVAFSSVPGINTSWWDAMPQASATVLGGIRLGTGLTYDPETGLVNATGGDGGGVTPVDSILNWETDKYSPYTSKQTGLNFYTGNTAPDGTTRLNINGYFYATRFYSTYFGGGLFSGTSINAANQGTTLGAQVMTIKGGGFQGNKGIVRIINDADIDENEDGCHLLELIRTTNLTGNVDGHIIKVIDNPTTTGTTAGKVFTAEVSNTERIFLYPRVPNSSNNIAYLLDTVNNLTASGAKLLWIGNNGVEKYSIDKSGFVFSSWGTLIEITASSSTITLTGPICKVKNSTALPANLATIDPPYTNFSGKISIVFDNTSTAAIYKDNTGNIIWGTNGISLLTGVVVDFWYNSTDSKWYANF